MAVSTRGEKEGGQQPNISLVLPAARRSRRLSFLANSVQTFVAYASISLVLTPARVSRRLCFLANRFPVDSYKPLSHVPAEVPEVRRVGLSLESW